MVTAADAIYGAYDLAIQSSFSLPELPPSAGRGDVVIVQAKLRNPGGDGTTGNQALPDGSAYLAYPGVGQFLIRGGREILVDPVDGVEPEQLRLYILGPAIGTVLHQRGLLVLHASAVAVGERAAIFLGHSGLGKSTLAAALHARGHRLVADDVAALLADGESPRVTPALPHIKLWPDSTRAVGGDPEVLPRLHSGVEKRRLTLGGGFAAKAVDVAAIFCLSVGDAFAVDPLSPREALLELIAHSYCGLLLRSKADASHFLRCSRVAQAVPAFRLRRTSSMADIPAAVRAVEEGLANGVG